MKRIKKILLALFVVVVLIVIIGAAYLQYTKPSYEGEYQLQNLAKETTVYYDDYGVPHIYADNQKDAMTTLGYVHAQDRLWQMELMRMRPDEFVVPCTFTLGCKRGQSGESWQSHGLCI